MHLIFRIFPLLAWLSVAACGSATAQKSAFAAASRSFTGPDGRLDYVAPLRTLLGQAAGYEPSSYAQALATYFSFVGQAAPVLPSAGQNPAVAYRLAEVPALLRARAQATSVVLINEAHDQPAHRAYCRQLLAQLAPLGYSYFAVEALNPADTAIATRKYPVSASGFYTCEPVMGQLLRAAADGGFHVFGHEITELQEREFASFERRTSYRDSMQAVNILAVLQRHPGAKIVALVGYDHVLEKERDGVKRLATYLHELAGIDPFTIDQTQGYRPATGPHATHPQALTTAGGRPATVGSNAGYVDLQIIHPAATQLHGRPRWLFAAGAPPTTRAIPRAHWGQPCLAQLFDAQEYRRHGDQAIPLDQCLTRAAQREVRLFAYKPARSVVVKYRPVTLPSH